MATQPNSVVKKSVDNLNYLCGQQVSLKFGKDDKQLFCSCLGVSTGQFILTQIPAVPAIEQKLAPGNGTIIRFVESGMVCGFKTRIQQAITMPFRLIFFDYPDSLELLNLRASKRVPLFINAILRLNDRNFEGSIRNLSEGGCFFVAEYWKSAPLAALTMESSLFILFTLFNDDTAVALQCRPVKVDSDKNEIRLGIAFGDNPSEIKCKIANFVGHVSQLLGNGDSYGAGPDTIRETSAGLQAME
ncbi:MAG: PilZ domain-containing protein [Pseudomonadota bacterium]